MEQPLQPVLYIGTGPGQFATISAAWNSLVGKHYEKATIMVPAGTWEAGLTLNGDVRFPVTIEGNTASPENYVLYHNSTYTLRLESTYAVSLRGLTILSM